YISIKFPLEGPDATVAGVCGIATDITERKRLESAAMHLAAIVESSSDAIVSKDLDGIITSWNEGAERIFGYAAAEAVGQPISLLAAPDRPNEMPEILAKIRRGERVQHYDTRRRRKDGRIIDVSLAVSPVRNAEGRIVGASKVAREITGRKQAEQERAALLSREREARRTAELLNRIGPKLASEIELEKLVQVVTDLATALVGAEFGSFFHNVVAEKGESYMLYTLSGAPREAFAQFPMPRNTAVFGPTFRGEGIVRCDDVTQDPRYGKNPPYHGMPKGHLPVRSYLAAPVRSRSGEVLGGLFFGHSIPGRFTESHEAILAGVAAQTAIAMDNARLFERAKWTQAELKRSNEELQNANHDLETFAYSASHDLQEPLRTISISAQLLERSCGNRLVNDDARFLASILASANRMNVLIQDLLAYTKAARHAEGQPPGID
ncbi:MAG: PAS domain S-box protein, partial [Bryobacteraceae bacterium]